MRTHRHREAFVCWRNKAQLGEIVSAETLQVARMEPTIRHLHAAAGLDLVFAKNGRYAIIPFVNLEASMLTEREKSPMIWPAIAAEIVEHETLEEIEALVLPWIEALSLGRSCNEEQIRRFGDDDAAWNVFQSAREAGFLGAAPYRRVLGDIAPYIYAVRFAADASIAIDDANGAAGAVILSRCARMVRANLGSAHLNAVASQWFGSPVFSDDLPPCDVRIGPSISASPNAKVRITTGALTGAAGTRIRVATPVPYDVMVSFDVDDAPEIASFYVECAKEVGLRTPIGGFTPDPAGGSGGRVLLLVRDDWKQAPDADIDDARELARRLRGEGFDVDIAGSGEAIDVSQYDLIHAFSLPHAAKLLPILRNAAARSIPCVVTAGLEDLTIDATWGVGLAPLLYKNSGDEESLADHLQLFAERRLESDGFNPKGQAPYPRYEADIREALTLVNAVLVSGPAEERFVRERFGFSGHVAPVAPYVDTGLRPATTEVLAGTGAFVLSHAPIQARANPLVLARAAMDSKLPLVLLGPVADTEVYSLLREMANEHVMFLPSASPEEVEALYRRARVYVDLSWAQYGSHRIAKAAMSGCSLVLSSRRYAAELWRPGMWLADPASVHSIASALTAAWANAGEGRQAAVDLGRRIAAACDPTAALVGTVTAYAAAAEAARLNCAPA